MLPPSFLPPPPPPRRIDWVKDGTKEEEEEEIKEMVGGDSSTQEIRFSIDESIPDELLFKILLCLPAQDIYVAARLVCRKWYNMMSTKDFRLKHFEGASYGLLYRNGSGNVVFTSAREDGGIETYKLNYDCEIRNEHLSCTWNGLMLECDSTFCELFYYVRNVSTDQAFHLPQFPCYHYSHEFRGIGYDAASMKYKAFVSFKKSEFECAILTVGVDKSWRRVCTDHLSTLGMYTIMSCPIITDGFVHWNKFDTTCVVTLNLDTEIIEETRPPGNPTVEDCCFSTGRYLSFFNKSGKLVWEVFEMKPETVEWRKFATICLEGEKGRIERLGFKHDDIEIEPCGWLKYPEVLALRVPNNNFIIFYNLITCEIGAEKLSTYKAYSPVTLHKNSLVWF